MSEEYLIGIGGQKCASTWLFDALARFAAVRPAPRKELDFFSYHHDRGHGWYAGHWRGPGLRLECSPSYLHDPRAPNRLRAFAPGARVIAILRDPVERAFSHHLHEIARGHIPAQGFIDALPATPDYLEQGRYPRHLSRWFAVFPPGQRLVLLQEEVFSDPAAALARLGDFLGRPAPAQTQALRAPKNVSDRPRSKTLRGGLRAGGRVARKLGMEDALVALKAARPVRGLMTWNDRPLRTTVPPLTAAEHRALAAQFMPDMELLAELLGRDSLPWQSWAMTPADGSAMIGTRSPADSPAGLRRVTDSPRR